jgi:hypothetical protein
MWPDFYALRPKQRRAVRAIRHLAFPNRQFCSNGYPLQNAWNSPLKYEGPIIFFSDPLFPMKSVGI